MLPYFSDLFISEEVGSSKPSERFFKTCIDRLNLKSEEEILPCEIMIIGDSLSSDMAGGIQFGMQTCFYNPDKKSIPCEMNLNYHVTSLKEIKIGAFAFCNGLKEFYVSSLEEIPLQPDMESKDVLYMILKF